MFSNNRKIKKSFKRVKEDIWHFKLNMGDWIRYLNGSNNKISERIDKIEAKLEKLSDKLEEKTVKN